jgi:hypothetical protein
MDPRVYALWRKVSASRTDKTRQVFFQAEYLNTLKAKLDRALLARRLEVQSLWLPRDSRRIFSSLLAHTCVQLTVQPLEVDRRVNPPRHSHYIQPKFELEVAFNGNGDLPQIKSMINCYLEQIF